MDGNRRWAKNRAASTDVGHTSGADTLMEVVEGAKELGIKTLTTYSFSTENWLRSETEVQLIMQIVETYLTNQLPTMLENGVRLETIGDTEVLPDRVKQALDRAKAATQHCTDITLVLALSYGSRDEIVRATKRIVDDIDQKKLQRDQLTEEVFASYLDTAPWPDPELYIRPGGEMRVSNFLLWQCSYSEIYVTETLWPDFTPRHLLEAIKTFQQRKRRYGS